MNETSATKQGTAAKPLDRTTALTRAQALVPLLKERANQCAIERRAPFDTIENLKASGLLRLMQPKRFGGSELGWDVFCEVVQILAAACGSQAWVYRVLGDHAKMIGTFPAQAQEDVWAENWDTQASSSFAPVGRTEIVDGGCQLSGRYTFSSGIDHAQWVICGGTIDRTENKGGIPHYFLVPISDVEIVDDWFVSGLEGSGSKSFVVKNAFVPDHRILDWHQANRGTTPGRLVNNAAIYRLPRGGYTTSAFAALLVGMAKGMFEDWLSLTAKRKSEGSPIATLESIQSTAGAVSADIAAAESLYLTNIQDSMRKVEAGKTLSSDHAVLVRCWVAYACQLAIGAAHKMRDSMGSHAVYRNSIERQYRNILAGAQHVAVNWPRTSSALGTILLHEAGADFAAKELNRYS